MGRPFLQRLTGSGESGQPASAFPISPEEAYETSPSSPTTTVRAVVCATPGCGVHFALRSSAESKTFHGRTGDATLFRAVVNVRHLEVSVRQLATGTHTVSDVACVGCSRIAGWYYLECPDSTQSFKLHKYVLENAFFKRVMIH